MPARNRVAVRRARRDPELREVHPRERSWGGSLKILISAAEVSSDLHAAELLRALKKEAERRGIELEAFGVGGPRLRAAGHETIVDARELLSMGFGEILGRLPRIFRALRTLEAAAAARKPDVAVVLDYPDFHFRLARKLRRLVIPVVYYIPPKVWVWRKGRVHTLRKLFARVLCIFPFEEEFFRREGLDVRYVGNPLVDELPLGLSRVEARSRLGLDGDRKVLLLMPGSRPAELAQHLEVMLEAALTVASGLGRGGADTLSVLLPFPETADRAALAERIAQWRERRDADRLLELRVSQGDAAVCMAAADAGLIKSGTSTLEAALMGCPHAVVYRTAASTAWIFKRLIRYRGPVGLVNLVAGVKGNQPRIAREILLEDVTVENLAAEATRLMGGAGEEMAAAFALIRERLRGPGSPSARAAAEVLDIALRRQAERERHA